MRPESKTTYSTDSSPSATTALVVEGGGMRGVFSAGVLDCFLEMGFDPFDIYLGVSAGACNLASHLGKQHGRNYRCYTIHMLKPDFFSIKKYLKGGHYMDLDWFWDHASEVEPLNVKEASKRDFYVGVTNVKTGKSEYVRADERTLYDVLKISSAVPLMYRGFIQMGGMEYTDGGVSDPISVVEAYRKGARRIMVIRSQVPGYDKESFIESKCIPFLFWKYPSFRKVLRERTLRYNETVDFMRHPPSDLELIEVSPGVLHSGRTTRDKEALILDYVEGKRIGLSAIRKWDEVPFTSLRPE